MADLSTLKGVDSKDRKMIEDAEALLGPEPTSMGFVKNLFWGGLREELVFPYREDRGWRLMRNENRAGRKGTMTETAGVRERFGNRIPSPSLSTPKEPRTK